MWKNILSELMSEPLSLSFGYFIQKSHLLQNMQQKPWKPTCYWTSSNVLTFCFALHCAELKLLVTSSAPLIFVSAREENCGPWNVFWILCVEPCCIKSFKISTVIAFLTFHLPSLWDSSIQQSSRILSSTELHCHIMSALFWPSQLFYLYFSFNVTDADSPNHSANRCHNLCFWW